MSKQKSPSGLAWGKADQALQDKAKFVLQQAQSNRYSVSRIYAVHNAIFELDEQPQTCATCLTSRVKRLREWWHANAPTNGYAAAGDTVGEATTYEAVQANYTLFTSFAPGVTELSYLRDTVEPNAGKWGLSAGELKLVNERIYTLIEEQDLDSRVLAKLIELGITPESSDADRLEAYEALASGTDSTPEEQALYKIRIAALKIGQPATAIQAYQVINMGENVLAMHFTPSPDDQSKGSVINADGSKVKAGTYKAADGTTIAVQVGGKATIK